MQSIRAHISLLFFILVSSSEATLILYEDFDSMPTGELNGQSSAPYLSGNWSAVTSISEINALAADMVVTNAAGETFTSSGNALAITGNNNATISADLATSVTGDFYMSMFVNMEAGDIGVNDFATLWLGEGSHIGAPAVGIKSNTGANNLDLMGRITGNQEAYSNLQMTVATPYLLVAKVSKVASTTYNQLDFWVNPLSTASLTPDATSTGTIAFDEFSALGIRSVNLDIGDIVLFDSLKIGTEWSDVVTPDPIPEPSSTLLIIISSCLLITRRSR